MHETVTESTEEEDIQGKPSLANQDNECIQPPAKGDETVTESTEGDIQGKPSLANQDNECTQLPSKGNETVAESTEEGDIQGKPSLANQGNEHTQPPSKGNETVAESTLIDKSIEGDETVAESAFIAEANVKLERLKSKEKWLENERGKTEEEKKKWSAYFIEQEENEIERMMKEDEAKIDMWKWIRFGERLLTKNRGYVEQC
ncbi:PREDICTED: uncharacterized protein LOC105313932 [Amphimedon queenslandica]|uniref:Uncharacterized protein n=1 Tax=Amphimedon queenslandica TaxID=400682 RepID=A0A1X7U5D8_AMPQE|nr:PREDICTED: uncharacterized protein LOC105313932 [Amphimedon queenslandica]|eukprot:XP_011406056.1 PREDICTED: uncharacterized protein LOC105313932 [Amphimedon queenslandica]